MSLGGNDRAFGEIFSNNVGRDQDFSSSDAHSLMTKLASCTKSVDGCRRQPKNNRRFPNGKKVHSASIVRWFCGPQ